MKQGGKRLSRIFTWVLGILFCVEMIAVFILSEWESDLKRIEPKLRIESAQWIPPQENTTDDFGEILVAVKNCSSKPKCYIPNLLFMNSDEQDAFGETLMPNRYYDSLSAEGAVDYSSSEMIPPGVTVEVHYQLTEQDARELDAMIRAKDTVYLRLAGYISEDKIYYKLQMQQEEE